MRKFMTSEILANMQYNLPEEYGNFFLQGCRNQIKPKGSEVNTSREKYLYDSFSFSF